MPSVTFMAFFATSLLPITTVSDAAMLQKLRRCNVPETGTVDTAKSCADTTSLGFLSSPFCSCPSGNSQQQPLFLPHNPMGQTTVPKARGRVKK